MRAALVLAVALLALAAVAAAASEREFAIDVYTPSGDVATLHNQEEVTSFERAVALAHPTFRFRSRRARARVGVLGDLWDWAKSKVLGAASWVKKELDGAWKDLKAGFGALGELIEEGASWAVDKVKAAIRKFIDEFLKTVARVKSEACKNPNSGACKFIGIAEGVCRKVIAGAASIGATIKATAEKIDAKLKEAYNKMIECVKAHLQFPQLLIMGATASLGAVGGTDMVFDFDTYEVSLFGYGGISLGTGTITAAAAGYLGFGIKGTMKGKPLKDAYSGDVVSAYGGATVADVDITGTVGIAAEAPKGTDIIQFGFKPKCEETLTVTLAAGVSCCLPIKVSAGIASVKFVELKSLYKCGGSGVRRAICMIKGLIPLAPVAPLLGPVFVAFAAAAVIKGL